MELFDLYNENRIKTGETLERGSPVPQGLYRMVVHICIFDDSGKMLIQRRQPFKKDWSGMWDLSVGGSSVSGDTSKGAAIREVGEEIGLALEESDLRCVLTIRTKHVFDDIYIVNKNVDESTLKLQPEEVAQVRWAGAEQIKEMIDKGEFIPYHHGLIDLLFFMKDRFGTLTAEDSTVPVSYEEYMKGRVS